MHASTYDYLKPTAIQLARMEKLRAATKAYAQVLQDELPAGVDKKFVIRSLRSVAMWANAAATRRGNGAPRR